MSHTGGRSSNRSWARDFFKDHPKLAQKALEAYSGTGATHDKPKVYCKLCLAKHTNEILGQDARAVEAGTRQFARSYDMIELELGQNEAGRGWVAARTEGLVNHLRQCKLQPTVVSEKADGAHRDRVSGPPAAGKRTRRDMEEESDDPGALSSSFQRQIPAFHVQTPSDTFQSPYTLSVVPRGSCSDFEREPSVASSISTSSSGRGPSSFTFPANPISISISISTRRNSVPLHLTLLKHSLNRPAAGFSLSWVENPEWLDFCNDFVLQAKLPSRKVLTKRLLPQTLNELQQKAKQRVRGKNATASCDGWTGENFHHYIAFMIMVDKKVHTVNSEWKVTVVAFTMDASGESRKARKLLLARFPHLVCPDCFAHQVNLIVGDYFKAESIYVKHSKMASDLISWLCSKTYVLARLREVQTQSGKPPLTVICAVLTRWTAHYLAFKRLLELQLPLRALVTHDAISVRKFST
ncbi:hypothetical protein EDB84DRAFT_1557976 [Lactarius hengduanensis]|nr:hypothetical protein EDB84DRAFT_1557976 [Lactarius hengduanensis]